MKTIIDYHDSNLKFDVLMLTNAFEKLKKK